MSRPYLYLLLGAMLSLSTQPVAAQEDEFRKSYEGFKKQAKEKYEDFRQKCNAEYAEFLKQAWKEYKTLPAIPRPKDETVPPVVISEEDKNKERDANPVPIDTVIAPIEKEQEPQPLPVSPIYEKQNSREDYLAFTFFGTNGKVRVPKDKTTSTAKQNAPLDFLPASLTLLNASLTGEKMAKAWENLSQGDYDNIIRDCLELRIRHQLCDWAYLLMLRGLSEQYCGGANNAATMLTAWLYCQSGYQMRLAMTEKKLYLLLGSKHQIFDFGYYNINGVSFYAFLHEGETLAEQVQICDTSFPEEQPLSLWIPQAQLFAEKLSSVRNIQSEDIPQLTAKVQVNQNLLDFFNTYPPSMVGENVCSRWAMYANTPVAANIVSGLYPQLRKLIAGQSQLNAVNILLHWVQTGLKYEYDDKVWGHDRAFFAEETLYYPYCDCEDRSILFTRLVRDLLGLDCILVYYPGHLAAAVCFTEKEVNGDYISLNGRKFVVSDATYIGAPVGMTMPNMDNVSAKVILLER